MTPSWKSQKFDAEGSTTAAGILKQLGRPNLDEFTVLVREAAQNSWDARRGDTDVDFSIRIERVGSRASTWQELLLPGPSEHSVRGFEQALDQDAWYLVVSDRGTGGLAGPIRATDRPRTGERNDFVQFLRNVGEPRDSSNGGGTYGFGKGIFYRTSSVKTVLADTRVRSDAGIERRLFGASLGADYWGEDGSRYTGRHWWGVDNQGVVDPLVGEAADQVATALGLPPFLLQDTGTNVIVLGADLGLVGSDDELGFADPHALGTHVASAILWNLWPKFKSVSGPDVLGMRFAVYVEGVQVEIPEPASIRAIRPFVDSAMKIAEGNGRKYMRSASPRIHAGDLAVSIGLAPTSESAVVGSARPFDGPPHHIARMREVGLVVDYFAGPPHPDPLAAYGGVFRATPEADEYFANSEPPTHDRWNPEGLDKMSRSVVDGARRWMREDLNQRFLMSTDEVAGFGSPGLGHGSRRLSGLMPGVRATAPHSGAPRGAGSGSGVGTGGGRSGASSTASTASTARIVGDSWIQPFADGLAVLTRVRVEDVSAPVRIRGCFDVLLDGGGRESESPYGESAPGMIGWMAEGDITITEFGATLTDFRGIRDWLAVGEFDDSVVVRFHLEIDATNGT